MFFYLYLYTYHLPVFVIYQKCRNYFAICVETEASWKKVFRCQYSGEVPLCLSKLD